MQILFVCLGNICRSPLAEGILREKLSSQPYIIIDSAGTGNWHAGEAPDRRSVATAREFGIDISSQRARQVVSADFEQFDLILAMDEQNRLDLLKIAPEHAAHKIHRILDFAGMGGAGVPDPWFGELDGFRDVYLLLEQACENIKERLLKG
ncbi:MAG: low molecular weight protein-tyrosine-phosphatase [Bacteroidota bacterium]